MQSLDKLYSSTQDVDNTSDLGRQRVDHVWRFRPPIAGRSGDMTFSYYNGSLVLELHVRLRGINSEPCNFCARFQSLLPEIYDGPSAAGGQVEIKLPLPDLGRDYIEQPMLVKIIEVAEQGEQGREGWVPSIVRLQSLDFCPSRHTQTLDPPLAFNEIGGGVRDRKLKSSFVSGRIDPAFMDGRRVDKMVKSATQIVNTIPDNARPTIQVRDGLNILNEETVAGTVSVDLLADDVRVAVNPSLQFAVESIGMFFGASNFDPATSKLRSEHTLILRC